MKTKLIIEGNAVYEIDEECLKRKEAEQEQEKNSQKPPVTEQ